MHRFTLLLFSLYCTCVCAQEPTVREVEADGGYRIEVMNPGYLPVSLSFQFELTNMRTEGTTDTVVVPARSTRTVHRIVPIDGRNRYGYRYHYRSFPGDYREQPYDTTFVYRLPYAGAVGRRVLQGYNGSFSHQQKAALDFDLPEGTPVHASRSGTVCEVEASNTRGCPNEGCMRFANLIRIVHADGTVAEYAHLRKGGATVRVGDEVARGDLIGYSGNTGFSSGPHLHFAVYQLRYGSRKFLPTPFRTAAGESILLVEGQLYADE